MHIRYLQRLLLAGLLVGTPSLIGCRAGQVNRFGSANAPRPEFIEDERFESDTELSNEIELVGIIEGSTQAGLKKVEAEFFNDTDDFSNVEYQFRWYDDQGFEINSQLSRWRTIGIQKKDIIRVSGIATARNAADFKLSIRRVEDD